MDEKKDMFQTIDEYIASFPTEIQERMQALRKVIRETAPAAQEKISWGMATFTLNGNLVHFAGQKSHIGFYPGASGVEQFQSELEGYKTSKGGIQFPYSQPMPFDLVRKIVAFRAQENMQEKMKK